MKKAVCMISSDPILKENCEKIDKVRIHLKDRMTFLQKQFDDAHNKMKKDAKEPWTQLIARLKALHLIPQDYDTEKGDSKLDISFDLEANMICLEEVNKNGIFQIINGNILQ